MKHFFFKGRLFICHIFITQNKRRGNLCTDVPPHRLRRGNFVHRETNLAQGTGKRGTLVSALLRTLQWSGEFLIPIRWICTRWISSGWWAVQCHFKSPVTEYQITICERCTEEHIRLFQAWITTDSIKIFSITCYTLVTVYCIFICEGERTIGHRWDEIDGNGG